jgi:hypothetical protein
MEDAQAAPAQPAPGSLRWRNLRNHVLVSDLLDLEVHGHARFQPGQKGGIARLEVHLHLRPLQALDRIVRDVQASRSGIDAVHHAMQLVRLRGGALRALLATALIGEASPSANRAQMAIDFMVVLWST